MFTAASTACLYPMQTEDAMNVLLETGFRTFEVFANTESELSNDYIDRMKEMLVYYDGSVYSVHLFTSGFEHIMFFSNYIRRFYDSVELYKRYFAAIKRLGASVAVLHGDKLDGRIDDDSYFERYALITQAARNEGIEAAQENVSRCRSRSAEFIRNMRNSGCFKFVLDVKQAIRSQTDPLDMLDAMGSDVINVHISDSIYGYNHTNDDIKDCLLPGRGDFDFGALIKKLKFYNYNGPLITEVYRHNFGEHYELAESLKYVRELLINT